MPRNSAFGVQQRRSQLIAYISSESRTANDIKAHFGIEQRTLQADIAYLKQHFPDNLNKVSLRGSGMREKAAYLWKGQPPHLLHGPIDWVSEEELLALSAAASFFASQETDQSEAGLGKTLHQLLERMRLQEEIDYFESDIVDVSRFGVEAFHTAFISLCVQALSTGRCLTFGYQSMGDQSYGRPAALRHVVPLRLQMIQSEWYVVAWHKGHVVSYKLSRMKDPEVTSNRPTGAPLHISKQDYRDATSGSFHAANGGRRTVVQIQFHHDILPLIQNRTWGQSTRITEDLDLDEGWYRLSFVTTGLSHCLHWILSHGDAMMVEKPTSLQEAVFDALEATQAYYSA